MDNYQKIRQQYSSSIEKMQKKRKNQLIWLITLSLILIIFSGVNIISMRRQAADNALGYVDRYTAQLTRLAARHIREKLTLVNNISDSVLRISKEDTQEFLDRKRGVCGLDFIIYCDLENGKVYTSGSSQGHVSEDGQEIGNLTVVKRSLTNESGTVAFQDGYVIYAAALREGAKTVGYFLGGNEQAAMQNILTDEIFEGQSYSCIIDHEGNIILSSEDKGAREKAYALFENPDYGIPIENDMKQMKKNLRAGRGGVFSISVKGQRDVYLSYDPLDINDWAMVSIVPSNLFSSISEGYVVRALAYELALLAILGCFSAAFFKSHDAMTNFLERLAFSDDVTDGGNKLDFQMKYEALCQAGKAGQYVVVLLDVVDFKHINEKHGEQKGSEMLKYFYRVIISCLNKENGEFAVRSEMDHFFLCLQEREPAALQVRLNEIIEDINAYGPLADPGLPRYRMIFRQGASFIENNDTDFTAVQDQARLAAKSSPKGEDGTCVCYSRELAKRLQDERELNDQFEEAIGSQDFKVYFQPKVSLRTKKVEGAEALVRWQHPERGLLSPAVFIPLLEAGDKIRTLDRYVCERTCEWMRTWIDRRNPCFPVSVNLSRVHFTETHFLERFVEITDRYQIPRELIEFELTESIFLDDAHLQKVREGVKQIHEYGFRCSIDDFGVGYSSLSLMREFDTDVLKLDRSFFLDLKDQKARSIISCVMNLAKALNIKTVAEGIETGDQIAYLKTTGCNIVQGYFFSKPLPADEFERWIEAFDYDRYDG